MEKYTIDYCKTNKVAIHVSSECDAISVIKILNAHKVYWDYFASDNTRFHHYKDQTCYSLIEGLMLGDVEHYKNDGFEIITAAQLLADNTPKLYTEEEVFTIANNAFYAAREGRFVSNPGGIQHLSISAMKYLTYTDYVNSNPNT